MIFSEMSKTNSAAYKKIEYRKSIFSPLKRNHSNGCLNFFGGCIPTPREVWFYNILPQYVNYQINYTQLHNCMHHCWYSSRFEQILLKINLPHSRKLGPHILLVLFSESHLQCFPRSFPFGLTQCCQGTFIQDNKFPPQFTV